MAEMIKLLIRFQERVKRYSLLEGHLKSEHIIAYVHTICIIHRGILVYQRIARSCHERLLPRRGNRISRHREWIIIGRRYFLVWSGCSLPRRFPRICIHIYNETWSRLNSSTFVARILWSAHVSRVTDPPARVVQSAATDI